ncbi:unnamed protein product [Trichobilharzia regenti]|nr:unnamed protein product [Trichobilharzia regenti]
MEVSLGLHNYPVDLYYSSSDDSVRGLRGIPNGSCGPHMNSTTPQKITNVPSTTTKAVIGNSDDITSSRSLSPNPYVSDTSDYDSVAEPGSLDAQLRMARQQRLRSSSVAAGPSSDSSTSNAPRIPGVDMMTDLQRVLAARRRAKEAEEVSSIN